MLRDGTNRHDRALSVVFCRPDGLGCVRHFDRWLRRRDRIALREAPRDPVRTLAGGHEHPHGCGLCPHNFRLVDGLARARNQTRRPALSRCVLPPQREATLARWNARASALWPLRNGDRRRSARSRCGFLTRRGLSSTPHGTHAPQKRFESESRCIAPENRGQ